MPRTLELSYGRATFARQIVKIDRSKLYGSIDIETVDADGNVCHLSTLASDGRTLIPNGGTAFGYVDPDGEWVERADLQPVDARGKPLKALPSSFDAPTRVTEEVDIETFLDHSIRLCYRLEGDDDIPKTMMKKLNAGAIFRIPFSYRGGVVPDVGFLLLGERGSLWLMIGEENSIDFIGLEEAALCGGDSVNDDESDEDEDTDPLDFGML